MIPEWDADGELPERIYPATLAELEVRFCKFVASGRRSQLFGLLRQLVLRAKESGMVQCIFVDGSFVTTKAAPNDIDIVLVLVKNIEFDHLDTLQYSVASRKALQRIFRRDDLDVMVVREKTAAERTAIEFFQTNRDNKRVGLVEVLFHGD